MRTVLAAGLWFLSAIALAGEESPPPPADAAAIDARIGAAERSHWAFRPVVRPDVPGLKDSAWVRNPVDAFILKRLEQEGWRPSPLAEPRTLVRRMTLDLIGLPPTLAEIEAFLAACDKIGLDAAADQLIDELLARSEYGERWARHWLDVVRYAETNGYERDGVKPHVWRYRDYVIQSLNDDKPFDRFATEQIAGDELPDANSDTVIATSFWRLGAWDDEPADPAEDRFEQLDDMVSTTSLAFLGLTLGCARCHDHKFDPLSQLDYYRLVAIVDPLQRYQQGRSDQDAPAGSRAQHEAIARRDREIAILREEIDKLRSKVLAKLLSSNEVQLPAEALAAFQTQPDKRSEKQREQVAKHSADLEKAVTAALSPASAQRIGELDRQIADLRSATPDLPLGYFLQESSPNPPQTRLLKRGKASSPGPVVLPGVPAVLVERQPELLPSDERTTRRRLSLARWLVDPRQPLTARVIVNRVWQHHIGAGLVRTPNDFGVMGDLPTHPELLDWLAEWFVQDGWSLKRLHKLVLSSHAYRMSKQTNAGYAAADPENRLLWRMPYRRLEVEAIRDSMLAVSGQLNRQAFGPSMFPFIPKEALAGHSDPDKTWPAYDEHEASRRTIYAHVKRSLVVPMLEVLDLCDSTRSAGRRDVTSVATQALTLFNGQFVNEQAAHFADRLRTEAGDDPSRQVDLAYRLALTRPPHPSEQAALVAYLGSERGKLLAETSAGNIAIDEAAARRQALVQMCRVIFNLNEFVYVD